MNAYSSSESTGAWEGQQNPAGPKGNKTKSKVWVHLRDLQQWLGGSRWRILSRLLAFGAFQRMGDQGHSLPSSSPAGGFCTLESPPLPHTLTLPCTHSVGFGLQRRNDKGRRSAICASPGPRWTTGQVAVRDGDRNRPVLKWGSTCE